MRVTAALILLAGVGAPQDQDKDKEKDKPNPHKGMSYYSQYQKAMDYLVANHSKSGYGLVPELFAGLAFMMDGRDEYADPFEKCVQAALRGYKNDTAFNGCWFVAYGAFFLATVYLRDPRPEIKEALENAITLAEKNVESTGGWCHHKGFAAESGYDKKGGGTDLGMVTATMLSAFYLMQAGGIKVPSSLIERATRNLQSISTGGGICYGTNNRVGDRAMSRIASALIGMNVAKQTQNPLYGPGAQGLPRAVQNTENGHAYGPIHFFSCAVAMHLMGQYPAYANHWLPILSGRQKEDGTISTTNDGKTDGEARFTSGHRVGSTAIFAIMCLLQKNKLFEPPKKVAGGGGPAPGSGGIFSKKPPRKDKDVPTGEQGPSGMIKPYVPENFDELNKPPGPMTGGGDMEEPQK
jgi:hypothetical protein